MKTIIGYAFVIIILCSCSQESKTIAEKEKTEQVNDSDQIDFNPDDTTRIVLLDLESTYLKRKDRSNANLTIDEYSQIQSLIENRLEEYNKEEEIRYSKLQIEYPNSKLKKEDFIINLSHYGRQYVAYINEKGEKEVWINCFCFVHNNEWKKAVFTASDGGNCFFNLTVNLTMNKVLDLSVNGNA